MSVFTWGRGEDGQLGLGDTNDQDLPVLVEALQGRSVEFIACGSGHTVVLTGDGKVYTWGRGDDGRLGHGDNGWKYVPRLVEVRCGASKPASQHHRSMSERQSEEKSVRHRGSLARP